MLCRITKGSYIAALCMHVNLKCLKVARLYISFILDSWPPQKVQLPQRCTLQFKCLLICNHGSYFFSSPCMYHM